MWSLTDEQTMRLARIGTFAHRVVALKYGRLNPEGITAILDQPAGRPASRCSLRTSTTASPLRSALRQAGADRLT